MRVFVFVILAVIVGALVPSAKACPVALASTRVVAVQQPVVAVQTFAVQAFATPVVAVQRTFGFGRGVFVVRQRGIAVRGAAIRVRR